MINAIFFEQTNNENVVELLDTVDFGEQLVNNSVVDSCIASYGTSWFADSIYFIEDYDVQTAVWASLQFKKNINNWISWINYK